MTTKRLAFLLITAALLLGALPIFAQPSPTPTVQTDRAECIPPGHPDGRGGARDAEEDDPDEKKRGRDRRDNGVIHSTVANLPGGTEPRLFFRWSLDEDFYYVKMTPDGGGKYWAVLPEAADKNELVEYYGAVVDPANQVIARSEMLNSPVENDCEVELTDRQHGTAKNLTIGETTFEQQGMEVDGFICDGVVTRIDPNGVLRSDPRCRACIIVWWEKPGIIAPTIAGAVAGGVLISQGGEPEASPSDP